MTHQTPDLSEMRASELVADEALWRKPAPDYCPDDLTEDIVCPACGASPLPAVPHNYCRARHNGRKPQPLVRIVLTYRDTGEPV